VSILTALPAVVVGGLSAEMPDGLYAHLAGLFLVPAALSAMLADLLFPDPQILPAWDAEADPAN
jgi:hypothetical protein